MFGTLVLMTGCLVASFFMAHIIWRYLLVEAAKDEFFNFHGDLSMEDELLND